MFLFLEEEEIKCTFQSQDFSQNPGKFVYDKYKYVVINSIIKAPTYSVSLEITGF